MHRRWGSLAVVTATRNPFREWPLFENPPAGELDPLIAPIGSAIGLSGLQRRAITSFGRDEAIAKPALRTDVARAVRIVAQLLAQASHIYPEVIDLVHVLA